ncbi:molybdate ABC transporter substrate-binding protein [Arhodomonas sp. AD133]|uniref:molybdate ABC transporter substrate-binding protein n=1 Tax=Arhodomonas sp. AD133 TaxID=3415009 RepID=UPI003EBB7AEA
MGNARTMAMIVGLIAGLLATSFAFTVHAAEIRIAVASNFANAMRDIVARYEAASGNDVVLAFGSTGKHYAQIVNGAPFDAFFAADGARPRRLETEGYIVGGSRFTYARGRIVLWSADAHAFTDPKQALRRAGFSRLAVANPRLAPYGLAAKQTLTELGLWRDLQGRIVMGENIGQTYQFVASGNAPLGFVALSQVRTPAADVVGSHWVVPESYHSPIRQQAVALADRPAVADFLEFVRGEAAAGIIRGFGYAIPGGE